MEGEHEAGEERRSLYPAGSPGGGVSSLCSGNLSGLPCLQYQLNSGEGGSIKLEKLGKSDTISLSSGGTMSKMIDIPDEVYARLEQQARARGLTVPQTIAQFVEEAEKARIAVAVERLRAKGILLTTAELSQPIPASFKPIQVQGKPLSEVIIEERR